jgi:hypothetical protein
MAVAVIGLGGALALGASTGAFAVESKNVRGARAAASSQAADPAVTTGTRSMNADELARAGRAVAAPGATTIYQARLADGTLELSDRPPTGGASDVARHTFPLPQDGVARQRAEAEREYWRRQADAFNRRQQERERETERVRADGPSTTVVFADPYPRRVVRNQWGWPQYESVSVLPAPAWGPVGLGWGSTPMGSAGSFGAAGSGYVGSPGAVGGRSSGGFIGSGFSTAR